MFEEYDDDDTTILPIDLTTTETTSPPDDDPLGMTITEVGLRIMSSLLFYAMM